MKILVTYFSNTGNTEKIAKSIYESLKDQKVDLKPVKDVNPLILKDYNLIFLGSGIYASRVNKSLLDLINDAQELPKNFAFFCTHASATGYQDGFRLVKKALKKYDLNILGEFDCMGENIGLSPQNIKSMMEKLPVEKRKEAEEHQKRLKGRPNQDDLEDARKFALSILQKL
ncbi:MAG: flavodoxin family protein [Candidatus Hodarchaeota archaeon]